MCTYLKLYTVPFFVSGQTYKISKGSNNYCSHCIIYPLPPIMLLYHSTFHPPTVFPCPRISLWFTPRHLERTIQVIWHVRVFAIFRCFHSSLIFISYCCLSLLCINCSTTSFLIFSCFFLQLFYHYSSFITYATHCPLIFSPPIIYLLIQAVCP